MQALVAAGPAAIVPDTVLMRAAGTWADLQAHPGPADRGIPFDDDDLDRIARTANDTSYGLRREGDLPHRQQRRTLHPAVRGSVAAYRG
jgi:hypothetical protein